MSKVFFSIRIKISSWNNEFLLEKEKKKQEQNQKTKNGLQFKKSFLISFFE